MPKAKVQEEVTENAGTTEPVTQDEQVHKRPLGAERSFRIALNNVLARLKDSLTEQGLAEEEINEIPEVSQANSVFFDFGFMPRESTANAIVDIKEQISEINMNSDDAPRQLEALTYRLRAAKSGKNLNPIDEEKSLFPHIYPDYAVDSDEDEETDGDGETEA